MLLEAAIAGVCAGLTLLLGRVVLSILSRAGRRTSARWGPDEVAAFLAVGRFTLDDWLALSDETRRAIAAMARAIDTDRIAAQGLAAQGHREAAAVLADADDAQALEDVAMKEGLAGMAMAFAEEARSRRERGRSL